MEFARIYVVIFTCLGLRPQIRPEIGSDAKYKAAGRVGKERRL